MRKLTLKKYLRIKRQDFHIERINSKSLREAWVIFRESLMGDKNRYKL